MDVDRYVILARLYKALWQSEDFEIDFSEDWRYVYERLQNNEEDKLTDGILNMCLDYLINWDTKREQWVASHP